MEWEVSAPRFVDEKWDPAAVAHRGDSGDVGAHAVVGGRDDHDGARVGRAGEAVVHRFRSRAVGQVGDGVDLGRHIAGDSPGDHQRRDDRLVRVARHENGLARVARRHQHRVVARRRPVHQEERLVGAIGLGRQALCLAQGRVGPAVEVVETGAQVELEGAGTEGAEQGLVGAAPLDVTGRVEGDVALRGIPHQRVEVGGAGLVHQPVGRVLEKVLDPDDRAWLSVSCAGSGWRDQKYSR